jgi:ribonuclease G
VSKFSTTIIIDSGPGETRGALLRAGVVWDVVHHRNAEPSLVGAIYRGRVRKVDHGLNGAFVEIGQGPQAYLRARDGSDPADKTPRNARIGERVNEGAKIDVRVVADGFADKGPRISRVTPDPAHADRPAPDCLQSPQTAVDLILERFVSSDTEQIICGDAAIENAARAWFATGDLPDLASGLTRGSGDLFAKHDIEDEIEAALSRRVRIPGGAELVIDMAEAMCVIDINSAGAVGKSGRASRDVNQKAMPEIARQLRLRNIAGAIVIDALKMSARDDRNRVLSALRNALKDDPGACHVLGITNLGLIEMTRTRTGLSLADRMLTLATVPGLSVDAVAYAGLRAVVRAAAAKPSGGYRLLVSQPVAEALGGRLQGARDQAAQTVGRLDIVVEADRANDRFEVMLGSA